MLDSQKPLKPGIASTAFAARARGVRRSSLARFRRSAAAGSSLAASLLGVILLSGLPVRAQDARQAQARKLFQQALADQKGGATASAVAEYGRFLRTYPQSPAVPLVRANLASALASLGQFDKAIPQYQKALAEAPGNPELRFDLGLAYFNQGAFRSAAAALSPLESEQPDNVRLGIVLANCEAHVGRYQQAISLLTRLEKKQPDNPDIEWSLGQALIQSGRSQQGLERIQKVADEGHNARACLIAAGLCLGLSRFNTARRDAEAAIRLDPRMPKAYVVLGMTKDYAGDEQEAKQDFRKALALNPGDLHARMELASVLYNQGKLELARAQVNIALAADPKSDAAPYLLGRIDRAEGKLQAALRNFQAAEGRNPDWIAPHLELTTLYYRLKQPAEGAREMRIVKQLSAKNRPLPATTRIIKPHVPARPE